MLNTHVGGGIREGECCSRFDQTDRSVETPPVDTAAQAGLDTCQNGV